MFKLPKKIKLVFFDFDGVFTDNSVYVDEKGNETVKCCRSDGIGLDRLRSINIESIVISRELNQVVKKRCEKLKIKCLIGCNDKLLELKKILKEKNIKKEEVCFVGNDIQDLACLEYVGFPIIVNDSLEEVHEKNIAKYKTKKNGGLGAVREICDIIYNKYKKG